MPLRMIWPVTAASTRFRRVPNVNAENRLLVHVGAKLDHLFDALSCALPNEI